MGRGGFEDLCYSLAREILGPDVEPFTENADGQRESSFDELDRHPIHATSPAWSGGYGVIQIRFRDIAAEDDSNWLLSQITAELDLWLNSKSQRYNSSRKPRYCLFVSNVNLADDKEASQRMNEIRRRVLALKLVDWAIWPASHLTKLLDGSREIRRQYGGFLVPGDILAQVGRYVPAGHMTDLCQAIADHAAKELIREQWIRLGQSGSPSNEKRTLSEIAVDLAAVERERRDDIGGVVRHVLEHGGTVLRPRHLTHFLNLARASAQRKESARWRKQRRDELRRQFADITNERLREVLAEEERRRPGAADINSTAPSIATNFVIIGGPGQGKTTLGQLLCQAYRVALLANRARETLGPAAETADKLAQRLKDLNLEIPRLRRWPIRIALSKLAEALSSGTDRSILQFIAAEISHASVVPITAGYMQTWLGAWPWLLVLDGLDEIALPAMRDRVHAKLLEFLFDAASVDADLLVVGTTRPQGYLDEFRPEQFKALTLKELDSEAAVSYARRLREVRHAEDPDMQQQLEKGIASALRDPATARLMRTPLQVTVMSLLLERRSRAPDNRYQLFDTYFETIYAREVAKEGYLGAILDEYRNDIHYVHQRVALLLQMRAEISGETESLLDSDELKELAVSRLLSEGMEFVAASRLADRLLKAATDRLVLLVPLVQDKIGFEVRSLQEYMAANAIASGSDGEVVRRLRILAPSSFWRNTWLLAAGNIFRQREHIRLQVIALLSEIDSESALAHMLMPSARLALDLLEDEVPGKARVFERVIVKHALQLLDVPPSAQVERLASVLVRAVRSDPAIRQIVRQKLEEALKTSDFRRLGAICFLSWWTNIDGMDSAWAYRKMLVAVRGLSGVERQQLVATLRMLPSKSLARLLGATMNTASTDRDVTKLIAELLDLPVDDPARARARAMIRKIWCRQISLSDLRIRESQIRGQGVSKSRNILIIQEELLRWSMEFPAKYWDLASQIRQGVEQWYSQRPVAELLEAPTETS
jgi:hypothetical protein